MRRETYVILASYVSTRKRPQRNMTTLSTHCLVVVMSPLIMWVLCPIMWTTVCERVQQSSVTVASEEQGSAKRKESDNRNGLVVSLEITRYRKREREREKRMIFL